MAEDRLEALGLEPAAFLVGWSAIGCDPSRMGIGPVPAIAKVLRKTGLSLDQMDLVEINEAFAVQVLACMRAMNWERHEVLNVNGSGISLGHPIGATGVRIMTTLLHELKLVQRALRAGKHVHWRRAGDGGQPRAGVKGLDMTPLDLHGISGPATC